MSKYILQYLETPASDISPSPRTTITDTREGIDQVECADSAAVSGPKPLGRTIKTATVESIDQSEMCDYLLSSPGRTSITKTREGVDTSEAADDSIDPYYI